MSSKPIYDFKKHSLKISFQGSNQQTLTPAILTDGLLQKRCAVSSFKMDNTSIPQFCPTLASDVIFTYANGGAAGSSYTNNTPSINSLNYFINVRNVLTNVCHTRFLTWNNTYNTSVAPFAAPATADESPYYYCFDFSKFMNYVANEITTGFGQHGINNVVSYLTSTETTTTFTLQYVQNYVVEFSRDLWWLFPFKSVITNPRGGIIDDTTSYAITFIPFPQSLNGVQVFTIE
jgi:hypothetical protein